MACRVVLCDDTEPYRRLLRVAFSVEPGLEVVAEASNGEEGIAAARDEKPDVMILDVAMPVLDGLEALTEIRAVSPSTRVIMLTGFASADVRRRALAGGASRYLEKGVSPQRLAVEIRKMCEEAA